MTDLVLIILMLPAGIIGWGVLGSIAMEVYEKRKRKIQARQG